MNTWGHIALKMEREALPVERWDGPVTIASEPLMTNTQLAVQEHKMAKEGKDKSLIVGLLAGIVGGVTAGLLLAPKAGKQTREIVREKSGNIMRSARGKLNRNKDPNG